MKRVNQIRYYSLRRMFISRSPSFFKNIFTQKAELIELGILFLTSRASGLAFLTLFSLPDIRKPSINLLNFKKKNNQLKKRSTFFSILLRSSGSSSLRKEELGSRCCLLAFDLSWTSRWTSSRGGTRRGSRGAPWCRIGWNGTSGREVFLQNIACFPLWILYIMTSMLPGLIYTLT